MSPPKLLAPLLVALVGCVAPAPTSARLRPRTWALRPPIETSLDVPSSARARPLEAVEAARPQARELTLSDAVARALAASPALRAADHEHAARRAEELQADRSPNPVLGLDVEDVAGSDSYRILDSAQTTLYVQQRFERGGKRAARERVARLAADEAWLETAVLAIDVAANARTAFWTALVAQEQRELARSAERTAEHVHAVVAERVAAGKVSPVEEAKHALTLATARLEREDAERAAAAASADLARCWGGPPSFDELVGELEVRQRPTAWAELAARLEESPRGRLLELLEQRGAAALEQAESLSSNDWTVGLGLRRFEATDDLAAVVTLQLPVPLLDPGRDRVHAARQRVHRAADERRARELELMRELSRAHARLVRAHEEATALDDRLVEEARDVFESVDEGYREGKFELLDVLDAQRTSLELQARRLRAFERFHLARTEVGRLTAVFE